MAAQKAPIAEWSDISSLYDNVLVADIRRLLVEQSRPKWDATIRKYLEWTAAHNRSLTDLYGGRRLVESGADTHAVMMMITQWCSSIIPIYQMETVETYGNRVVTILMWLGEKQGGRNYPPVYLRHIRLPARKSLKPRNKPRSLGQLDWPECDLPPGVPRERAALIAVRNRAVQEVQEAFELFKFGQRVMSTPAPQRGNQRKWTVFRNALLMEASCFKETGKALWCAENKARAGKGDVPVDVEIGGQALLTLSL